MKTPKEIKRGLECCVATELGDCSACPYDYYVDCTGILLLDTICLIEKIEAQIPSWIPAEERLPENYDVVMVVAKVPGYEPYVTMDIYLQEEQRWDDCGKAGEIATHWMPLPEPPVEVHK